MFFSNTNQTNLTNLVGCDMVCIRGIREIRGQLNIIHTLICFSNTNRTNLTNLFRLRHGMYSWDSGDLWSTEYNSYANMFFSKTNRTNLTNLFRLRHGMYSWDSGDLWSS